MTTVEVRRNAAIAIAATFTADPIVPTLRFMLEEAGLQLDVHIAPYRQVLQELLAPTSLLARNAGGVNVVLVRVEDFARDALTIDDARDTIRQIVPDLCDALTSHARRVIVPTIFAALPPSSRVAMALRRELDAADAAMVEHARAVPGLLVLSAEDVALVSTQPRHDDAGDELGHIPFTEEHYAALALAIARKVHALRVPARKVLVLDCDDTLWRGVVGEDGVEGITIPGPLARLQQFAVAIQAQGALICLVSKNADRDVLSVFEERSDMILRLDHVVAHRINWESKPVNVASLARALNLGLEAFVFLDDSPLECARMRSELPQVVTLQVPPEAEMESFLSHLWTFDHVSVTDEDLRRTDMYREHTARQAFEESATDFAAFIDSLRVVVDIAAPEDGEWLRLAQLTQRTNQFTCTPARRTEPEMRALQTAGYPVLRVRVRDRFGDYGIVGLVIVNAVERALAVETFLLSCRALGRGVEHTILRRLGEMARERALLYVDLPYMPTDRNEPARAFVEGVAASFRVPTDGRIVYRIPVDVACSSAHNLAHGPVAVTDTHKSPEREHRASATAVASSDRYARLARVLVSDVRVLQSVRARTMKSRALSGAPAPPTTDMEQALVKLWQELIGVAGLGVDDDFQALGGTSLIAARLFAEIARRFGIRLPLTTILDAPTVRLLARRLERQGPARPSGLIELRSGGPRNLFLVHDGDGETLLYLNLARRMPDDLAVFGVAPRHIDRVPLGHATIEDMASFYLEEVRKKQPRGPYLFGGMCAGGVIAYEMAAQLERAGERVELVALLDAAAPQAVKRRGRIANARFLRLQEVMKYARHVGHGRAQQARLVVVAISQKLTSALMWEVAERGKQWSVHARFRLLRQVLARKGAWPRFIPGLSVRQIYESAEACYVPRPLAVASVVLVRARSGEDGDTPYRDIYVEQSFGWGSLARNLTIVDADGGHSSMLKESMVDSLARVLESSLGPIAAGRHGSRGARGSAENGPGTTTPARRPAAHSSSQ